MIKLKHQSGFIFVILVLILLSISCRNEDQDTDSEEIANELQVEIVSEIAPEPSATDTQHCTTILNTTDLPDWLDDPMLIEVLDDGRIIVVGYSTSDSMALISADLETVEGYRFENGQGTLTAIRSDGLSIYALIVLILNEYDIRSGRHLGVSGSYEKGAIWNFDCDSDLFLTLSILNNEISLMWINSAGAVIQSVSDPLRLDGDQNPLVMVPNGIALDSHQNAWVTSGADGTVCIYRITGQLLSSFTNDQIPVFIRRYREKMLIGSGNSFSLYDLSGARLSAGILPEYCIDIDFNRNGNAVALTRRGEVILMEIPSLDYVAE
ncbi:MAG: hypothetical protein K8S62_00150 [Candidatus Sabulitectum sp.]|nr:hypothetical protein [Candidatus Sabulitectum sp.]